LSEVLQIIDVQYWGELQASKEALDYRKILLLWPGEHECRTLTAFGLLLITTTFSLSD
jgi:hypothetical protein